MVWTVEFDKDAFKELAKLDKEMQRRILNYLRQRLSIAQNPHVLGKALQGNYLGLWRYRVGNYRIICSLEAEKHRIVVQRIGHRSDVYN